MTRYRKKPVEVEAWQVGSDEPIPKWLICGYYDDDGMLPVHLIGNDTVKIPQKTWAVSEDGELARFMTEEAFNQTYEVIE